MIGKRRLLSATAVLALGGCVPHGDALPLSAATLVDSRTFLRYDDEVAEVVRVVDGDTVIVVVNVWIDVAITERCRVLGVDTPERNEAGYAQATAFTASWLTGRDLRVATTKRDSFGRILCDLYDRAADAHLSNALLAAGLAVPP